MKGLGIPASNYVVVYGDPTSDPTLAASAAKVTSGGVNGIVMLPVDPTLMVKAIRSTGTRRPQLDQLFDRGGPPTNGEFC